MTTNIKECRTLTDENVSALLWTLTMMLMSKKSKSNDRMLVIIKQHMDLLDGDSKTVAAAKLKSYLDGDVAASVQGE